MFFSEILWTGLYTASGALLLALINQCYKSKCREVNLCCIRIIINVAIEETIDRAIVRSPISPKRGSPSEI